MTVTPIDVSQNAGVVPVPVELAEVKGWFFAVDQVLFDWFLSRQLDREEGGDLLEVGVFQGKSAIFTGGYLRAGDTFTVCDLFDTPAEDADNSAEMRRSYPSLTRHSFEVNYLAFHDALPRVIQGPSTMVTEHVKPNSCRFAHIDASHLYEHVRGDIADAAELLLPHGIVALDDYRSEHTPGVAAATWEAVTSKGLNAVCVSGTKFYGTWGDATAVRDELLAFLDGRPDIAHEVQSVAGAPLIRVNGAKVLPPAQPPSRHRREPDPAPPTPEPADEPGPAPKPPTRSAGRRLLVNVLPPFVTKAVVRYRGSRRRRAAARAQAPANAPEAGDDDHGAEIRAQVPAQVPVQVPAQDGPPQE